MEMLLNPPTLAVLAHGVLFVAVAVRVIMLRPAPGVALAWLLLVAGLPLAGIVLYLAFGERRIGQRRARRMALQRGDFDEFGRSFVEDHMTAIDWSQHPRHIEMLNNLGINKRGVPAFIGNSLTLLSDTLEILDAIAADVDAAQSSVQMAFYIWHEGGAADDVVEAVLRAADRGVRCRILVDAVGSKKWLGGRQPQRLREAGVEVRAALPTGLVRGLFSRNDLRLHRKIVTIDGTVGWTGSMNLVDPRFFKQDAGVGEWVDAMVRVQGNAVLALGATLAADWQLETGEELRDLIESADLDRVTTAGSSLVQVIPSGPGESDDAILQMLLGMINSASRELVLTTPYFVPDDSMLRAIVGASARGVEVTLVLPEKVDSNLVRFASRSYYDDLVKAGVRIQRFRGGLLHTKSITVDGEISMIGTVNLDMRSLWLNYEVSLFIYDTDFTERLRNLQQGYIEDCETIDPGAWTDRPFAPRFVENAVRLVSPLL